MSPKISLGLIHLTVVELSSYCYCCCAPILCLDDGCAISPVFYLQPRYWKTALPPPLSGHIHCRIDELLLISSHRQQPTLACCERWGELWLLVGRLSPQICLVYYPLINYKDMAKEKVYRP